MIFLMENLKDKGMVNGHLNRRITGSIGWVEVGREMSEGYRFLLRGGNGDLKYKWSTEMYKKVREVLRN